LSAIDIVESHDIILAEIAADLNLDEFKRDFTRIGGAVSAPVRDVCASFTVDAHGADPLVARPSC
jgi:hypothetical protein